MKDNFDKLLEQLTIEEKIELRTRIDRAIYHDVCKQAEEKYLASRRN